MELAQDAGARVGLARSNDWQGRSIGDLGWCFGPGIRRSNFAVAVTGRGKVATFPMSVQTPEGALRLLATLPDDLAPPVREEAQSEPVGSFIDRDQAQRAAKEGHLTIFTGRGGGPWRSLVRRLFG